MSSTTSAWRASAVAALLLVACGSSHPIRGGDTSPGTGTSLPASTTCTTSTPTTSVTTTSLAPTTSLVPTTTAPTAAPTTAPTTVAPTTVAPTTVAPTTVAPTVPPTVKPTVPTTVKPTVPPTVAPTTTRPPSGASSLVWRLPTSQKVVAITFDAGSDLGFTDQVLDTLKAKGVRISFGITGAWADSHPAAVARMAAEGHQVMNHSYTHRSFTGASATNPLLTTAERQADLARAEATLSALIGCSTKPFWRPPYGDTNAGVLADAGAAGYAFTIMWTVDSGGWKGLSADEIVQRVTTKVEPGAIIAFHVGSSSQDSAALGRIVDALRASGYTFVTLAQAYGT